MARAVTCWRRLIAALSLALLPVWSAALGPKDPFTPPLPAASTAPGDDSSTTPVVVTGLRGVRLGRQPAALIDGEWVGPGQTVRGAKLADVRLDGALLRHADGRTEFIALFPVVRAPAEAAGVSIRVAHKRANKRGPP
jgi:hypothetical protein